MSKRRKQKDDKLLIENKKLKAKNKWLENQIQQYRRALKRGSQIETKTAKVKIDPENFDECLSIRKKINCAQCIRYNSDDCLDKGYRDKQK